MTAGFHIMESRLFIRGNDMTLIASSSDSVVAVNQLTEIPDALQTHILDKLGCDIKSPLADGLFHSFKTPGDAISHTPGRMAGYVLINPEQRIGVVGSHRPGEFPITVVRFSIPGLPDPTDADREAFFTQVNEQRPLAQEKARLEVQVVWDKAETDLRHHAYLAAHGVGDIGQNVANAGGVRRHLSGQLAVPMHDAVGTIRNLQAINAQGDKRFFPGARVKGLGLWVPHAPEPHQTWFVVEGFAKALAVHAATELPVLCAFSANNVLACLIEFQSVAHLAHCAIAADNDSAGRTAVAEAQKQFPQLRVVYPAEGNGDWNDILVNQGMDALKAALTILSQPNPPSLEVEGPELLSHPAEPAESYPVLAFGPWAALIERVTTVMNVSPLMVGQSFIAAASLAVQGLADISIDGRRYPLSEFLITIASSGERKSAVDKIMLEPHRAFERELKVNTDALKAEVGVKQKLLKVAESKIIKNGKDGDTDTVGAALQVLGEAPTDPPTQLLLVNDLTLEGLTKLLQNNRPSVGAITDEGGRILGGWALGKDQVTRTIAGFSSFWDGSPLVIIRAGTDVVQLYGRRLALHWQVQPGVAELMFGRAEFCDQGFLWRYLIGQPPLSLPAAYQAIDLSNDPLVCAYYARIRELLEKPLPLVTNEAGQPLLELVPAVLEFDPPAKALWVENFNRLEGLAAQDSPLFPIRGYVRKAAEHIARLAGIFTLMNDPEAQTVPVEAVEFGSTLMLDFYLPEMLRLHEGNLVSPEIVAAERLLKWVRGRQYIHLAEVYQHGPRPIRTKAAAIQAITTLVNHGWLTHEVSGREIDGIQRKDVWKVVQGEGQ